MNSKLPNLYAIPPGDFPRLVEPCLSAFESYPKLLSAFPDLQRRRLALKAVFLKYGRYDIRYGAAWSTAPDLKDFILTVDSREMGYTLFRYLRSGAFSAPYFQTLRKLSPGERRKLKRVFAELDEKEAEISLPNPHLYIDFLAVDPAFQGQGRGRRLIGETCRYADSQGLPCMLFTNTPADIRFYEKEGFSVAGETLFQQYGFVNTYMVRPLGGSPL